MRELYKLIIIIALVVSVSFSLGYIVEKQEVHAAYIQGLSNGIPFALGMVNSATNGDVYPSDPDAREYQTYKLGQKYYSANQTERDEIFKLLSSGR